MRYAKYAAAIIGYIYYGFWGALIGFFLGAWLSNRFSRSSAGMFGVNPKTREQRQSGFIKTLFLLMGKLAKADGRVSEAEIAHAEAFMQQLGMTPEHRKEAIRLFKQGARSEFSLDETISEFKTTTGNAANLKQLLVMYLLGAALADGKIELVEQELLREIAIKLGFSEQSFNQLLMMIQAQSQFRGGGYQYSGGGQQSSAASAASSLSSAYQALGVDKDISDSALKKSYRKLMSEFHPDRLIGQGLPEDMIKVATERSKEIQAAYDLIKKSRGIN
ncbi:co-chaperone DjlA [Leucothrix pacifica]|uniref:Co-chaperone DjlA n=1 Tax=Leucothrix pacifica TaxID=1247513 RepID=A0A317CF60_9GAMM|nr:co-chaperone DjlA [Leucothrix pacifica]PWQ94960.1 co-chaperone DjlA [Leucothrix pacifica]